VMVEGEYVTLVKRSCEELARVVKAAVEAAVA